ncbi:hypothetical protein LX36DRAFT_664399 [Colletotrichum falcatum]|nr:hypothetical protein LX36DRAFT_664399 [Colletotrichum falcatum]
MRACKDMHPSHRLARWAQISAPKPVAVAAVSIRHRDDGDDDDDDDDVDDDDDDASVSTLTMPLSQRLGILPRARAHRGLLLGARGGGPLGCRDLFWLERSRC